MIKIQHPAAIVRDREKQVTEWEGVRYYKYANGIEYQILLGELPHGATQSIVSANRALRLEMVDSILHVIFETEPATIVNFLAGERPREESPSTRVVDSCHFLPSLRVKIKRGDEEQALVEQDQLLVASFSDGTVVEVEPHGGHGHVSAYRDGIALNTFYHGPDDTLYVFDSAQLKRLT